MDSIDVSKQGLLGLIDTVEIQDQLIVDTVGLLADLEIESCGATAARLRRAMGILSGARRHYQRSRDALGVVDDGGLRAARADLLADPG